MNLPPLWTTVIFSGLNLFFSRSRFFFLAQDQYKALSFVEAISDTAYLTS